MTVTLNPFEGDQTALVPIGTAYSVTLGKMLDAGKTVDDSYTVLPYIRAANIQDDGLRLADVNEMPFSEDEAARLDLRRGDLLVVEGGAVGTNTVVDHDMPGWSFQKTVNRVRPISDWSTRYLGYVLRAYRDAGVIDLVCNGSTIPHLTAEKLRALRIPSARPSEQRAIADYLGRETARIDTLIAEQQRLIELLDERRDAVIAEGTTKGVSPGVTLVESGVGWLGGIPEEWSVKALRRCGTLLTGSTPPTDDRSNFAEEANERPWVRPQDLSSETRASAWLTAEGWSLLRQVPAGSVLVGCIAYSLGSVGHLPVTATTNQQITSIVPAEDGRYLYYVMLAANSELWAASQVNRVPILNNQRLGAIRVPVPPIEEQRLIAAYLDEQTEKIDRTKAESKRFIELARERRSALITAAVTGQIDVQEMA